MTTSLPQPALDLLSAAFPAEPLAEVAPTLSGFSHHSAVVSLGGRRAVVKAAHSPPKRADLRREARALALLRDSGLPVAPLLALLEDEDWTVELVGFVAGTPGLRMLADTPGELPAVYGALGRLLAAVHDTPLGAPPPDLLMADRADATLRALPSLGLDAGLRAELAAALAHPAWRPAAPALVHGDAGLHNVLWDAGVTALLDWEWAGWGDPSLDITWVYWTIRWRDLPIGLWQAFLSGYDRGCAERPGDGPPAKPYRPPLSLWRDQADDGRLTVDDSAGMHIVYRQSSIVKMTALLHAHAMRGLAVGQIAGILVRAQGDAGAWAEWLRRARWTLALDFYGALH
jgi:aminoglycoside phosphotransferase (APT) family kinase protein